MANALQTLASIAEGQIGTRESGNNAGPEIFKYQASTWIKGQGWPWCAAFVCWCVQQLAKRGLPDFGMLANELPRTPVAFDFEAWGRKIGAMVCNLDGGRDRFFPPMRGDIVIYRFSHIGIVIQDANDNGLFEAVEGNTGAAGEREGTRVLRKPRRIKEVRAIVRIPLRAQPLTGRMSRTQSGTLALALAALCVVAPSTSHAADFGGLTPVQIGLGVIFTGGMITLLVKFDALKKSVVDQAVTAMSAGQQPQKRTIQQPLEIKETPDYALASEVREIQRQLPTLATRSEVQELRDHLDSSVQRITAAGETRAEGLREEMRDNYNMLQVRMLDMNTRLTDAVGQIKGEIRKRSAR